VSKVEDFLGWVGILLVFLTGLFTLRIYLQPQPQFLQQLSFSLLGTSFFCKRDYGFSKALRFTTTRSPA